MVDFRPEEFAGKTIKLQSPVGAGSLEINWPLTKDKEIIHARIKELTDTVSFVLKDFSDFHNSLLQTQLVEFYDNRSFDAAQELAKIFNRNVNTNVKLNRGTQKFTAQCSKKIEKDVLDHILRQVYRASITDPTSLNKYQSFTSETYGETNFLQMDAIIKGITWSEEDVFVDLGSGIGSLVMQVAAVTATPKAVGIEIQPTPNKYAKSMDANFRKIMKWYGFAHHNYDLYDGDFTKQIYKNVKNGKQVKFDWKTEATVVFVNNYAFSEDLNLQLKRIFGDMQIGTKIISTKAFCPIDFKINDRNAGNDIGCFVKVTEVASIRDGFSWTNNVVQVYMSTIDHSALHNFYASKTKKVHSATKDRSSSNSPIDFVERPSTEHKKKLKQRPMKKPNKDKFDNSRESSPLSRPAGKPKVGTKRGSHGRTVGNDPTLREAFDFFHEEQVKSFSNKPDAEPTRGIPKDSSKSAWQKVTKSWQQRFDDTIQTFYNMSQTNLDRILEEEKDVLAKLTKLVSDEENRVQKLHNTYKAKCQEQLKSRYNQRREGVIKTEEHLTTMNSSILDRFSKMKQNQSVIHSIHGRGDVKIENGLPKEPPRPSIIQFMNTDVDGFASRSHPNPSPQSVPLSPHSTKSSPSSDLNPRVNGHAGPNGGVKGRRDHRPDPAQHFPIHLSFPGLLPCGPESPRSKRRRSSDVDRPKTVITPVHPSTSLPTTSQQSKPPMLHSLPPSLLRPPPSVIIPGAQLLTNGNGLPRSNPGAPDPKIYGGLGGFVPTTVSSTHPNGDGPRPAIPVSTSMGIPTLPHGMPLSALYGIPFQQFNHYSPFPLTMSHRVPHPRSVGHPSVIQQPIQQHTKKAPSNK